MTTRSSRAILGGFVLLLTASCGGPPPFEGHRSMKPEDEERAASFESAFLIQKVKNLAPRAHWIGDSDRFWLRNEAENGVSFEVIDGQTGAREPAFDHAALAQALTEAGVDGASAEALPIVGLDLSSDTHLSVATATGTFSCTADGSACEEAASLAPPVTERPAPDGERVAFARDHNLWVRDSAGRERALTTDGEEGFAYGAAGFDLGRVARRRSGGELALANVNWSPDGRYVAVMRTDLRGLEHRSYVKEHLPPDKTFTVAHIEPFVTAIEARQLEREISVIDTRTGRQTRAQLEASRLQDFAPLHFAAGHLWWSLSEEGSGELFLVTADVHGLTYGLAAMDLGTGATRSVVKETEEHYYAFNARDYNRPNFHVTADGGEAIFYSQRSGNGHLYLYDAHTGALRNAITEGDWVVFDLVRVDEAEELVYFTAGGKEEGRDPYFTHLYRVSFAGGAPELLTPEDAHHDFSIGALPVPGLGGGGSGFSPSGEVFVDVFSTTLQPPKMVLRRDDGELIAEILEADISSLVEMGWAPPERFVVKAADGETDLWGALFKPTDFDPDLSYAVVDQTYPGPQIDSGPHSFLDNFAAITTNNAQATAEAGFVVVALDGRGTTRRSRDFRYAFAGTQDIFGAADHKAAIENLARDRPYLDTSRVGITGASFGGFGSVRAALLFPDFFDVVVSHVGPHHYHHFVSGISVERFFGVPGSERDHYDESDNLALVDQLQAELMLVYGEIDENVPLRAGMEIFNALVEADKDFTSYVMPNADHGGASRHPYIVKRQRRFFREHLGGALPR